MAVCKDDDSTSSFTQRNKLAYIPRSTLAEPNLATPQRVVRPLVPAYSWNRTPAGRAHQINVLNESEIDRNLCNLRGPHSTSPASADMEAETVPLDSQLPITNRNVSAIRMQPNNQIRDRVQPSTRYSQSANIICWQCEQAGHSFPTCQNPKNFIFCYRCGKKGSTSRNCPDCMARLAQALPEGSLPPQSGNARSGFPQ